MCIVFILFLGAEFNTANAEAKNISLCIIIYQVSLDDAFSR